MKGFHLFEIIIVLSVLSVLSAFSWKYLGQYSTDFQLRMSAEELISFMESRRSKAILSNQTCQLIFQQDHILSRDKEDFSANWTMSSSFIPSHSVLLSTSGPVSFYSSGFASPRTVNLSLNGFKHRLIININGRIRYEKS